MKNVRWTFNILLAGSLFGLILCGPTKIYGQDTGSRYDLPEGIYIGLTKEFYEALKNEGSRGAEIYTNDPSKIYLKEIAVSARFMVETNLQILRQQESMLQLLRSLLEGKKK